MKQRELARKLARSTRKSPAEAQDQIDALVQKILKDLREGRPVELPGMGKLFSKRAVKAKPEAKTKRKR